jgi:preprotein translocase subunit SecY
LRRCIAFTLCVLLVLGATYLAAACVIFEFVVAFARVPFYFGGIAALVAVCATLDLLHRSAETGW